MYCPLAMFSGTKTFVDEIEARTLLADEVSRRRASIYWTQWPKSDMRFMIFLEPDSLRSSEASAMCFGVLTHAIVYRIFWTRESGCDERSSV